MEKQLIYQVCVGETPKFYDVCTDSVRKYAERIGADYHLQTEPILRIRPLKSCRSDNALRLGFLPILEKSHAFSYLGQYEQVAVIDADVYIRSVAPDIFGSRQGAAGTDQRWDFAGCLERDMPLLPHYRDKVKKYSTGQYSTLTDVDWLWDENGAAFYNCGVVVLGPGFKESLNGQTPTEFLRRPEFERFIDGRGHFRWSTDQTLWNYHVKKSGMTTQNLDWRWNALYGAVKDVTEAHFVHFFLSAKMPRQGAEIPEIIERL